MMYVIIAINSSFIGLRQRWKVLRFFQMKLDTISSDSKMETGKNSYLIRISNGGDLPMLKLVDRKNGLQQLELWMIVVTEWACDG